MKVLTPTVETVECFIEALNPVPKCLLDLVHGVENSSGRYQEGIYLQTVACSLTSSGPDSIQRLKLRRQGHNRLTEVDLF